MNELFTTDNLERAGLAVSLLFSMWINYKIHKDNTRVISNHIVHSTQAQAKFTSAINQLIKLIEQKVR
mgnify:CR=1 FL=1